MAVYREDIADVELSTGRVSRTFLNHPLGEGDAEADIFGIRVWKNGEAVNLAGNTCTGYFIRADGTTEVITGGTASGNVALLMLPAACYAVEGNFQLAIQLTSGGKTKTLRIVDGTVVNVVHGPINDPGGVVPDLDSEALTDLLDRVETAATTIAGYTVEAELLEDDNYQITVTTVTTE